MSSGCHIPSLHDNDSGVTLNPEQYNNRPTLALNFPTSKLLGTQRAVIAHQYVPALTERIRNYLHFFRTARPRHVIGTFQMQTPLQRKDATCRRVTPALSYFPQTPLFQHPPNTDEKYETNLASWLNTQTPVVPNTKPQRPSVRISTRVSFPHCVTR